MCLMRDWAVTTPEMLAELLRVIEPRIPEMTCRIFPSSFDPDDKDLRAFPRAIDWQWMSCERALRSAGSKGVMTRLPAYWQMGFPLHAACRAVGIPLFANGAENIPVGAMAIKTGGIDTVVSESRDAGAFADYLVKRALPYPRLGILVHRIQDTWDVPRTVLDTWDTVAQEVHAFPGVPVLDQCAVLSDKKVSRFHLSDEYSWEVNGTEALMTSIGDALLPFYQYKLPRALRKAGTCSCGKPVFELLI